VNSQDVLAFFALFEVRQLSEDLKREPIIEMFQPCAPGQLYLRSIIPYVQRYLHTHYPEVLEVHDEAKMEDRLMNLQVVKVGCHLFADSRIRIIIILFVNCTYP
jgi:hypothetical protein